MAITPVPGDSEKCVNELVSAEVFAEHQDSTFWIGRVASMGVVELPEYYDALGRFRANVYVSQLNYLPEETLDSQGRELDEYDCRSIHFSAVERVDDTNARIVGSLRLVTKEEPDERYPIEGYFPEVFEEPIAATSTAEVSRFIARYPEDRFEQHLVSLSLIRAATYYAVNEDVKDFFCVIEEPLLKLLSKIGIPLSVIGDSKFIPEQNGVLYPVQIKPQEIIDSVMTDKTGNVMLRDFFAEEANNAGEGYYTQDLIGGKH